MAVVLLAALLQRKRPHKTSQRSKGGYPINSNSTLTVLISLIRTGTPASKILMASFEGPNYENGIDFKALAKSDPEFAAIYSANNSWVDFKNPKAVKYLHLASASTFTNSFVGNSPSHF